MIVGPDHWVEGVRREEIPGGATMAVRRFLVIHHTAGGSAMSSICWWRQLNKGVCAHFVIDRDGTIYQCRPCNRTAGHAGASSWRDPNTGFRYFALNRCSIGIELANGGDSYPDKFTTLQPVTAAHKHGGKIRLWEAYDKRQLASCESLAKALVERYNLDDVVGHEDIAPGRKVDPGPAFPMQSLREACGFKGLPKP